MKETLQKGNTMPEDKTLPETPDAVEVEAPKKKFKLNKPKINKEKIRNGALLVAAGAVSVLLVQRQTGKTVDLELSTPDIVEESDEDND